MPTSLISISDLQANANKPKVEFVEDVLKLIFKCLLRPIPMPGSSPPRSEIRQPYLAKLMRVSKKFRLLATPLLYTSIVTDDFALFFSHTESPRKVEQLKYTKILRIEYSEKTSVDEPTYAYLMENKTESGGLDGSSVKVWDRYYNTGSDQCKRRMKEGRMDFTGIRRRLAELQNKSIRNLLPNLKTCIISSIYGRPDEFWNAFQGASPQQELAEAADHFLKFISSSKHPLQLCLYDVYGPLTIPQVSHGSPINLTVHFGHTDGRRLPVRVGSTVRWIYDGPADVLWDRLIYDVGYSVTQLYGQRIWSKDKPLDLTVTCSAAIGPLSLQPFDAEQLLFGFTSSFSTPHFPQITDEIDLRVAKLEEVMRASLAQSAKYNNSFVVDDKFYWEKSSEARTCSACESNSTPQKDFGQGCESQ